MPKIIIAFQNETIRKRSGDDVLLATIGLMANEAVIIQDQKGNASLTHVNYCTNLEFIKNEIKFMDGKYTIDIVKNMNELENPFLMIRQKLEEFGLGSILNSKGTKDIRNTKHGTVLLQGTTLFTPTAKDIEELECGKVSADNKFKNHTVDPLTLEESLKIYARQINIFFSSKKEQFPVVKYDNKHYDQSPVLLIPEAQKFLDSLTEETIKSPERLAKAIIMAQKDIFVSPAIVQSLAVTISRYHEINKDKERGKLTKNTAQIGLKGAEPIKGEPKKAYDKLSDSISPRDQEMKKPAVSGLNKSLVFWNSVQQKGLKGLSRLENLLYYAYQEHIKTKKETKNIPEQESKYNAADEKLIDIVPMVVELIKSLDGRFSKQKIYEIATKVATDIKKFDDKDYKDSKRELKALRKLAWKGLSPDEKSEEKTKINTLRAERSNRKKQADTGLQP